MTGGVTSGAENISAVAAAAAAAAAEPEFADAAFARAAASEPQFPLKLHVSAGVLQVFSGGPHGSKTVSVRIPVTD